MSEPEYFCRHCGVTTTYKYGIDEVSGLCGSCKQFQKDARTEAAAEAYARCRQLAASTRLPVAVDDQGKGWQRGVEAVVRKISNASPDPSYSSRIRREVLTRLRELQRKLSVSHISTNPHDWALLLIEARTVIDELLEEAK